MGKKRRKIKMRNVLTGKEQIGLWTRSVGMFRWIPSAVIAVAVAALFSLAAPSAKADTWDFSLTNPGNTTNINFSFDTTAPSTDLGGWFQIDSPVDWTLNSTDQGTTALAFFSQSQGGGLWLGNEGSILNLWGPQLYTGTEASPTLVAGTYSFDSCCNGQFVGPQFDGPLTLTLTDPVSTPEPSSVLLLGAGLLGILGMVGYQSRRSKMVVSDLT
jgi:hypothetical protein